VRAVIQADGTLRPVTWGVPGWESANPDRAQRYYDDLAKLPAAKARAKIVEQLRESGHLVGEPRPITHAREVLRKGRPAARDRLERQWFFKTIEFRDALARARPRAEMAPRVHADAVRELGERPQRRLVRQPPAVLRRPVPVWYPISDRGRVEHDRPIAAADDRLPSIRRPTCRRATRRRSAACRAGSSAIPT